MWGGRTLPALVYIAGLFEAITYVFISPYVHIYCARATSDPHIKVCKSLGSYTLQLLPKAVVLHLEH